MRGSAIAASLVLSLALSAAPVFAQAAGQAKPAQTPAPPPAPTAPPAPAPGPPAPFPQGAKIAFFNPQVVFQASADGKAALARVNNLIQKKQKEAEDKAKMLQGNQQKLQTSGSVMNEAARSQLEKEIEKQQKDGERFQQDAQAEVQELQQEVQNEFVKKLSPIVNELATEKGLHIVFNAGEAGIAWAMAGLDLTGDVIKKLDAQAAKPATTPKE
jgi:Skp family chaperone for outer membrane proteins